MPDGRWKKFLRLDVDEFHQIMSERGACSFDEPDTAERILKAAKEVDYFQTLTAAKPAWYIYKSCDWYRTSKKTAAAILQKYGLTVEQFAEARLAYHDAQTAERIKAWKAMPSAPSLPVAHETADKRAEAGLTCQEINSTAPEGWQIKPVGAKFNVQFSGQSVATVDSLALAKVLTPEKFFEQFRPLVDKDFDADKQFIADRKAEIAALQEMRDELVGDTERLKIIDKLIAQNELAS